MKILMITPWYPDEQSPNSGIFIRAQAKALAEKHQVVVVAAKVDYKRKGFHSYSRAESKYGSVVEYRISIAQSWPVYNQLNHLLITSQQALRIGREFKPDIVHASIGYPGAILGWRLSKKLGVPFVFTEHTRLTNNYRSPWHKSLTKFGIKKASGVMAVSSSLAQELQQVASVKVDVIPNIVEVEKFRDVQPSLEAIPQIGFLGGMNTNVKGLDMLLKAMSEISSPFVLHIGGTGKLFEEYKRLAGELGIESKCRFYGFIQPEHIADFYSRLHFLVCSSRYETFNVSLIEAMACGLPVVSTRCGGPEDFVNEENGLLCAKENEASLRVACGQMMHQFSAYSTSRLKSFAAKFSPDEVSKRIEDFYHSAIRE